MLAEVYVPRQACESLVRSAFWVFTRVFDLPESGLKLEFILRCPFVFLEASIKDA